MSGPEEPEAVFDIQIKEDYGREQNIIILSGLGSCSAMHDINCSHIHCSHIHQIAVVFLDRRLNALLAQCQHGARSFSLFSQHPEVIDMIVCLPPALCISSWQTASSRPGTPPPSPLQITQGKMPDNRETDTDVF